MIKKMAQRLKEEKGLTLIELLAVVVILGIIAAIAIPSIGGLIDNSKKDAHVGNAQQMINSAKTWASGNSNPITAAGVTLSLQDLYNDNLLDTIKDPDGKGYETGGPGDQTGSFVQITLNSNNNYQYQVKLTNGTRGIWQYQDNLTRDNVVANSSLKQPSAPTN